MNNKENNSLAAELKDFVEKLPRDGENSPGHSFALPTLDDQSYLLQSSDGDNQHSEAVLKDDIKDAAVFSADALRAYDPENLPQHSLLGTTDVMGRDHLGSNSKLDGRLFHNTTIPFSIFICGLQGSGKSHTLSCVIGEIPDSLSGPLR